MKSDDTADDVPDDDDSHGQHDPPMCLPCYAGDTKMAFGRPVEHNLTFINPAGTQR